MAATILGWLCAALALVGSLYMLIAARALRRFFAGRGSAPAPGVASVTLLKPLHGAEPRLDENLRTFLAQDHAGPLEMLCGVASPADAALPVAGALARTDARVHAVVDATRHGANAKVSNLANLVPRATGEVLVLSDSDMAVAPDYLARLLAALGRPGVGAVTCLYRGRGDAGFWSRLGAMGLSYQFLPGAVLAVAHGLAEPCMGSTIALRRETLDAIGGFARIADDLADDHALGAAVRGLGLAVAVPPMLLVHASAEESFAALWRHELRWGVTVRDLGALAYAGSVVTFPLPFALLALPLLGPHWPALAVLGASLLGRCAVLREVDTLAGARTGSGWLLPLRDCLSLAVFGASLVTRSVDWRGRRLRIRGHGQIAVTPESRP